MVNPHFVPSNQMMTKVLCHTCMNPAALEMKPPTDIDHVHSDFGRPNEETHATHENFQELFFSMLTVETCNTFTISDTITLQFSEPAFHNSRWQLVRCIRRQTRTWNRVYEMVVSVGLVCPSRSHHSTATQCTAVQNVNLGSATLSAYVVAEHRCV